MLKLSALVLVAWSIAVPARAGLFADDDARERIQLLEARVIKLEDALSQQTKIINQQTSSINQQSATISQQTKSMLDLQGQMDALNAEMRNFRGQNEELAHGLQEAERRSKDFYVDLDARLRHFEAAEEAAKQAAENMPQQVVSASAVSASDVVATDQYDPVLENRAIESAYALFKGGSDANAVKAFREFLTKYPGSVHVPNAMFWMGDALLKQKGYKGALNTFQELLRTFPGNAKSADTLFNIATCQQVLKQQPAARKTLTELVDLYPASEAAAKAKKLLASKD
ncbi:MAG: tol-pal system protein YbgF [Gallionella sp.]